MVSTDNRDTRVPPSEVQDAFSACVGAQQSVAHGNEGDICGLTLY